MPDGGRDALAVTDLRGTIVFQVKFARDPNAIKDPVAWVKKAIDGELEKVQELANRGATEYILITNVRGTSHLDVGRIDKVNEYLEEKVPLPASCWWRDDLDRRLDNNFDLKLRYPALLSGTDMLRLIWDRGESGQRGIENTALRAYLAAQYEQDKTVRFKQAELSASSLFQIFVDVPVTAAKRSRKSEIDRRVSFYIAAVGRRLVQQQEVGRSGSRRGQKGQAAIPHRSNFVRDSDGTIYVERYENSGIFDTLRVGAADALLDAEFSRRVRFVVLEGAPGQGKSTLTQYLGQVNRARLLGGNRTRGLPVNHANSPIAVPLRIELRDLAQWLNGQDPWADERQREHGKQASLEGALAAQIYHLSGGAPFNIRELHQLLGSTPVQLLLDGLDEVADLDDRRRVVDEVLAAVTRLEGISKQLNVLVTSRPTVVSGTPTFPEERFMFLKLSAIHRDLALEYTDRWARARSLTDKDRVEVRRILAEKMDAPHMAELAKNTMQLSILLSLIYLRGASLPDKRTELYDTYIDTFLNRESEKSPIVRKNRRLLVEIHRYLAFYLHASAEGKKTSGRIRSVELRKLVAEYLVREGRSPDLVDDLVIGAVERVVALVSRVEGTYEFEVQPLREYFAARYLYDTAPYSPAGRARTGTKPDRFDAVARNPYWLNVTRFFAGCFSKGELLDLADRLCALIRSNDNKFATYSRSLAIAFLQDWVFTQSVTATSQIVTTVFDDYGIRVYGGSNYNRVDQVEIEDNFVLSEESGGSQLVKLLWDELKSEPKRTQRTDCLCRLLWRHVSPDDRAELWLAEAQKRRGDRLEGWFSIGRFLGAFYHVPAKELERIIGGTAVTRAPRLLGAVARGGGRLELFEQQAFDTAIRQCLAVPRSIIEPGKTSVVRFLTAVLPDLWIGIARRGYPVHVSPGIRLADKQDLPIPLDAYREEIMQRLDGRFQSVEAWTEALQVLDGTFGKNWTSLELAVISASVPDVRARWAGASDLFATDHHATARVRFAKRKFRATDWWIDQGEKASDELDKAFWLVTTFVWADTAATAACIPLIDSYMRGFSPDVRMAVAYACERGGLYSDRARRTLPMRPEQVHDAEMHLHTFALISSRLAVLDDVMMNAFSDQLREPWVASAYLRVASVFFDQGLISVDKFLEIAEECHASGARYRHYAPKESAYHRRIREAAPEIIARSRSLPDELIFRAQAANRRIRKPRPVLAIAEEEDWMGREDA
jgi:hypothetical protein